MEEIQKETVISRPIIREIYDRQMIMQDQLDGIAMRIKDNHDMIIKLMALIDLHLTVKKEETLTRSDSSTSIAKPKRVASINRIKTPTDK